MDVLVYHAQPFERPHLERAFESSPHALHFVEGRLTEDNIGLAAGYSAISCFVHDRLNREVLLRLRKGGTSFIALRCSGHDHVDLESARELGIRVANVPDYTPYAVAEHAAALVLALARRLPVAYQLGKSGDFRLDHLVGTQLHGKTVGVVGTGRIGRAFGRIMRGLGCRLIAHDPLPSQEYALETGCEYMGLHEVFRASDVLSLQLPLTPETHHMMDEANLRRLKPGVIFINTSRGGLVDTWALLQLLQEGRIAAAGLDVLEGEPGLFFHDHSARGTPNDSLILLQALPNVLVTGHQGYLTHEALWQIADGTRRNVDEQAQGRPLSRGLA